MSPSGAPPGAPPLCPGPTRGPWSVTQSSSGRLGYAYNVHTSPAMTITHKILTIRVDEELLDCDFAHPAASIEEATRAWEGCTPARWDDGDEVNKSEQLLQAIADALWGEDADKEWNADTLDAIAEAIMNVRPDLYNDRVN